MATGSCSTPSPAAAADAGGMIEMDGVADFSIYPTAVSRVNSTGRSYFMRLYRTNHNHRRSPASTHLVAAYKDVQGGGHRAGLT